MELLLSMIAIVAAAIVALATILFFNISYPRIRHRKLLEKICADGAYRILRADERNALSYYLSLSVENYTKLLGGYGYRNDGWSGDWSLISDRVYGAHVVFKICSIERFFSQYRFCQAGVLRFNLPPIWEGLEGTKCEIEFVLTDKLPVVVAINGYSLVEGAGFIEHFFDSDKAIQDFEHQYHPVGPIASPQEDLYTPPPQEETPAATPVEGIYLPAGTRDDSEEDVDLKTDHGSSEQATPSATPVNVPETRTAMSMTEVEEAEIISEQLTGSDSAKTNKEGAEEKETETSRDVSSEQQRPHADHASSHDNGRLGDQTDAVPEQDVSGIAVINARKMSLTEAFYIYGPLLQYALGLLTLIAGGLLIWSGGSFTSSQDALSLLCIIVLAATLVGWATLSRWIPRPQIKTVQGRLGMGRFHPRYPTLRTLSIGNLSISTLNRASDTFTDSDLGKVMSLDLTPKRQVIAINGKSVLKGTRRSLFATPLFLGATLLVLAVALITNTSLLAPYTYVSEAFDGPRRVTLRTLEEAQAYTPAAGDVLDISALPVLCILGQDDLPDCNSLQPEAPIPLSLPQDPKRHQALAALQKGNDDIHAKTLPTTQIRPSYMSMSAYPVEVSQETQYIVHDPRATARALKPFKNRMGSEAYGIAIEILTSDYLSTPLDRDHPNDIVLDGHLGEILHTILENVLSKEHEKDVDGVRSILAHQDRRTPWFIRSFDHYELKYFNGETAIRQDKPTLQLAAPSDSFPAPTGHRDWDDFLNHLAHHYSGTLTLSGQVQDVDTIYPYGFSVRTDYHTPFFIARVLSLATVILLVGLATKSAIALMHRYRPSATKQAD
ncbi:IgaA/UmoB family intracellular growth attenuator [Zymobacter sp. IVIA_12111.31 C1]|uniref:IgaA/UmoB family intracellular growth attenuator n=1 Tax=Zymobacter sp. IVIA_12111.31 C1 TaxID=3394854 RepID=UPI0039C3212C